MFPDNDDVLGGFPDLGEIGKIIGNQLKQGEQKGFQPCGDVQAGHQPLGDGLTIEEEDFDMPTVHDTLEGDDGDRETD